MAVGLRIPFKVNIDGGLAFDSGDRELIDTLKLALSPGEDDNPFQQLGIDEESIFDVNDSAAQGVLRSRIRRILSKFSDRIALDPSQPIQFFQATDGELGVSFRYVNLETNESTDFQEVIA